MGVMVSGRLLQLADKHALFGNSKHLYTKMLLDAIPKMHDTGRGRTPRSLVTRWCDFNASVSLTHGCIAINRYL
jgi:ABC-type dipeptide/oligopeptide/nickel transport system ATPase component